MAGIAVTESTVDKSLFVCVCCLVGRLLLHAWSPCYTLRWGETEWRTASSSSYLDAWACSLSRYTSPHPYLNTLGPSVVDQLQWNSAFNVWGPFWLAIRNTILFIYIFFFHSLTKKSIPSVYALTVYDSDVMICDSLLICWAHLTMRVIFQSPFCQTWHPVVHL